MEGGSSGEKIQEESNNLQGSAKTVEIKIKTLDSQVYTCHVEETISVPALKEQIAALTGVPVENQRLICRGKVLKDEHILSAYNVEDGHTLHLVTRQFPQPGAPSSSGGTSGSAGDGEQQGFIDSPHAGTRSRSGQVSHSVVLGTFNIPDPGDGVVPDVGRIITSMLTSLGITNLVPTNAGANNGVSIGGTIIPNATQPPAVNLQERPGAGGGGPQMGSEGQHPSPPEQAGVQSMGPQNESLYSTWPIGGGTPTLGQHIRLMQQAMVIPDALTTMSHYLNRLEQVFPVTGQQQGEGPVPGASSHSPGTQTSSVFASQPIGSQAAFTGHPTPANLGSMVRRAIGLINNSVGTELARLASQLEHEQNLADATARGDLNALALRSGILMQHLGALLLELGRSTLTLRMGSSPSESAVNPGPALFISPAGPNPMMVQPLPFQPGAGFGNLPGVLQQNVGAVGPALGSHEVVPRNINIHIHASDSGLASGVPSPFPIPSQVPPRMQTDGSNNRVSSSTQASSTSTSLAASIDRASTPTQAPTAGTLNQAASGSNVMVTPNISVSLGSSGLPPAIEQARARVMPMRTVVAAMPVALHNRPPNETTGNALSAFYPLLARFQQLNSTHAPQQGGSSQGASPNRAPPVLPVVQPETAPLQQPVNPAVPLTQARGQVQAQVPCATNETPQGQGEPVPMSQGESSHIPSTSSLLESSSMDLQSQQPLDDGMDLMRNRQMPMPQSAFVPFTRSSNTVTAGGDTLLADRQHPLVPNETAPLVDGASTIEMNVHQNHENEPEIQPHIEAELYRGTIQSQATASSSGENNVRAGPGSGRTESKRKLKSKELPSAPAGLGLGGLQPLPARIPRVPNRQQPTEQALGTFGRAVHNSNASSGLQEDDLTPGKNTLQGFLLSSAPRLEETRTDGSAQISAGASQSGSSEGGSQSNVGIGNSISQAIANSSGGNSSGTPMARDNDQGLASSSRALGGIMGQLLQNPLFRNVVRQVADQVREEPQGFEDMVSQGSLSFSGVLQQMMPIVSQALGRVATNSTEPGSIRRESSGERNNVHGTEQIDEAMCRSEDVLSQGDFSGVLQQVMPIVSQALGRVTAASEQGLGVARENAGGSGGTHVVNDVGQARNATSGFENVLSQHGDSQSGLNLSAILQQMLPVVAQAVGQATEGASEQARSSLCDAEGAGFVSGQERRKQPQNQDKLSQQDQIANVKQHQSTAEMQWPVNEIYSGSAPVAKRQKIDLERAVRKLEQDRSPQEIFQVIAEIATMLIASNGSPGMDIFSLAEQLSQDESLVNDYISLLSQDFSNQTSEDSAVKDSHSNTNE